MRHQLFAHLDAFDIEVSLFYNAARISINIKYSVFIRMLGQRSHRGYAEFLFSAARV